MNKKRKILLSLLAISTFTLSVGAQFTPNVVEAKFGFSSSAGSKSSGGFSFSQPASSSSSSSRTGTFRSQTQQRNATLNKTQSSVNNRTTSAINSQRTSSYNRGGMFGGNSFFGSMMGGMFGGMISRMLFGGMGYNNGMYQSGPGFFMSSFINVIFWIIILVIVWKIIKRLFRGQTNNQTPIYNNSSYNDVNNDSYVSQSVVNENNQDFANQKIELTKQDAKNYIQNLPIGAEEKLNYITKVDKMNSEDQIVDFVENIERELDSKINISVEEGRNQALSYVNQQMTWLSSDDKTLLMSKIKLASSLNEIENAIAPFDK